MSESLVSKLRSLLPRKGFGRAVAIVSGGTALGQLVTILASPLLSRLYTPADFGELAVYLSLSGTIAMVAGLTYQVAIPVPDEHEEAANVLALATTLVLIVGVLCVAAFVLAGPWVADWPRAARVAPWMWTVPFGVVGLGLFEAVTQWAIRSKQFGPLARTTAAKGVAQVTVQSIWGAVAPGPVGLVVGQLVGQWAGTFGLARSAWRNQRDAISRVSLSGIWAAAKRYRRFPFFTLPAVVVNAVSNYAPVLLFAYYFGGAVAGLYAFQDRVTLIPLRFVGASAQRVFMGSAADARREGRLGSFTYEVLGQLLIVTSPFVALLAAAAPGAFALVFGDQWREAGVYAQWLCLRTIATTVVFPLTPVVYVLEKQWAEPIFQGSLLACRVGPVLLGGMLGSARLAVVAVSIGVALSWFVYLIFLLRISGNRAAPILLLVLREAVIAAALALPVAGARVLGYSDVTTTLLAAALGLVALGVVWRRLRSRGSKALLDAS